MKMFGLIFGLVCTMVIAVGLACGDMPDHCAQKLRRHYSRLVTELQDVAAQQNAILALREMRSSPVSPRAHYAGQTAPDPPCPRHLEQSGTLSQRATCPWVEQRQFVADRYPPVLADVKCICDRCVGKNTSKEACQKVEHEVPVFYVTDRERCEYEVSTDVVATACTCAAEVVNSARSRHEALRGPTHATTTKRSVDSVLEKMRAWKLQRDREEQKDLERKKNKKNKDKKRHKGRKNRRRRRRHSSNSNKELSGLGFLHSSDVSPSN